MEKLINVRGRSLNVFVNGSGPAVMFVHGFPLDHSMWRNQLEYFSNSHTVIAPDLRGFGKSQVGEEESVSMKDYADDLAALVEAMDLEEPVSLCGLSMGGYIGWQLLKFHRHLFGPIIFANTRAASDDEKTARGRRLVANQVLKHGLNEIAHQMPLKLLGDSASSELQSEIRGVISAADPRSVAAAQRGMSERPDMTWFLSKIDNPVLLVCGSQDEITPSDEMRAMADQISGSTYHEISGVGHMTPLEAPEEFNKVVAKFLLKN